MTSRILAWTDEAWDSYVYWQRCDPALCGAVSFRTAKDARERATRQTQDKKTLKRINKLIKATKNTPFEGIGKPEPLKENLSGFWSRRIDDTNRLVYAVDDNYLTIISCHFHY
ncbi:Txe/YoeB family addiction module toxin [Pleurocapsa sp. PCC 7319]|uniref:Txe/YoeB family addiction module toxin n=1 Tax=Pleurocapsa sp. PCC 7319 TaxID=118161 RepID=UPI000361FFAA|nr:Txe/YoeB family addiction module toxin [Pleurocapsa sp. PCC 7319]